MGLARPCFLEASEAIAFVHRLIFGVFLKLLKDSQLVIFVQSCNRANMNVTVKLEDRLVKMARHRAVDCGVSLSGWLASLIEREVEGGPREKRKPLRLLEALGDESVAGLEFEPPRLKDEPQSVVFDE